MYQKLKIEARQTFSESHFSALAKLASASLHDFDKVRSKNHTMRRRVRNTDDRFFVARALSPDSVARECAKCTYFEPCSATNSIMGQPYQL